MDLYVDAPMDEVADIFRMAGFEVRQGRDCHHAIQANGRGRFHAEFARLGDRVYCDLHFDHPVHVLFVGVDYRKRPREFFEDRLRRLFNRRSIPVVVSDVGWLTRRNRAIFRGFRL